MEKDNKNKNNLKSEQLTEIFHFKLKKTPQEKEEMKQMLKRYKETLIRYGIGKDWEKELIN